MSAVQLIVYLLVAALAGLIAERLVGTGLLGGIAGTILAALLGIWLMVRVLGLVIPGDLDLGGAEDERRRLAGQQARARRPQH